MITAAGIESILWDDWHVVADFEQLRALGHLDTVLLDVPLRLQVVAANGAAESAAGTAVVAAGGAASGVEVRAGSHTVEHVAVKYGFVFVCLGTPRQPPVSFAECEEPGRLIASGGSVQVAVSGLRAVENFLDLAHLPFVHTGYLGEESHADIASYQVEPLPQGGIIATGCKVYQPKPSPVASRGFDVDYVYAVLRPYIVVLWKANPIRQDRKDMIALLVQPRTEESCVAHSLTCYLPHETEVASVRRYQQLIFGQDRPILENQLPKRLPLSLGAELSVRADGSSVAYRRWLQSAGVRFGAITALAG